MTFTVEAEATLPSRSTIDRGFTYGARHELLERAYRGPTTTFLAREGTRVLLTLINLLDEIRFPIRSLGRQIFLTLF